MLNKRIAKSSHQQRFKKEAPDSKEELFIDLDEKHHLEKVFKANSIFEKLIPTARERAEQGLPSMRHVKEHGYSICSQFGDVSIQEQEYYHLSLMVGLGVDIFSTKEGHLHPARITLVTAQLKYLFHQKVKPEGHILNYHQDLTGLDSHAMSDVTCTRQEMVKKLVKLISTSTIMFSFDPAEHLHLMKVVHFRIIDLRMLFEKDLELGLEIDRMSLVRRYLPDEFVSQSEAIQAIALALRYYSAYQWRCNVAKNQNVPLYPMLPAQMIEEDSIASKQRLITTIHRILAWKYRAYYIRPPTPVLIGPTVIRVHVKKWGQLRRIVDFIADLSAHIRQVLHIKLEGDDHHEEFRLISLPISMKSKAQMKGFFCYIHFEDEERARIAVDYFDGGKTIQGELVRYKCEVYDDSRAIPKQGSLMFRSVPKQSKQESVAQEKCRAELRKSYDIISRAESTKRLG